MALTVTACKAPDVRTSRPGGTATPTPSGSGADATPARLAYGMMLNNGRWTGPRDQAGDPDLSIIDDILTEKAGYAVPRYMRLTSAAPSGPELPASGSVELQAAQKLAAGGVQLGVAVDTYPNGTGRSADSVLAQAQQIRTASEQAGRIYSWIFLDMAVHRTPAGGHRLNDLQQVVDGVIAAGWSKVIINATGFTPQNFQNLPLRA